MPRLLFLIHAISILMLTGCAVAVMRESVTDENVSMESGGKKPVINADAIVPAYVVDTKELFGLGMIDLYFHIIEIQWFEAEKLGRPEKKMGPVTQIRVSVW